MPDRGEDVEPRSSGRSRRRDPMRILTAGALAVTVIVFLFTIEGMRRERSNSAPNVADAGAGAVVTSVTGAVHVVYGGKGEPVSVDIGTGIAAADAVRTGPDGRVILKFKDGDEIRLFENGRLTMHDSTFGHGVRLEQGTLFADVSAGPGTTGLSLTTDRARLTTLAGRYLVRSDRGRTTLGVGRGDVTVTRTVDGAAVGLHGGQNASIGDGADFRTGDGCFCAALGHEVAQDIQQMNGVAVNAAVLRRAPLPRYRGTLPSLSRQVGGTVGGARRARSAK